MVTGQKEAPSQADPGQPETAVGPQNLFQIHTNRSCTAKARVCRMPGVSLQKLGSGRRSDCGFRTNTQKKYVSG